MTSELVVKNRWQKLAESERKKLFELERTNAADILDPVERRKAEHILAWSLLEGFSTKGSGVSSATLRSYKTGLKQLVEFLQGNLLNITIDTGDNYLNVIQKTGLSTSTLKSRLSAASKYHSALLWCGFKKIPYTNPFLDKGVKGGKGLQRRYIVDAQKELFTSATQAPETKNKRKDNQNKQVAAILGLTILAGLRGQEVCSLLWNDVHPNDKVIQVKDSKGGKSRSVPYTAELKEILTALPKRGNFVLMHNYGKGATAKPYTTDALRRLVKKYLGDSYKGLHSFRRLFADGNKHLGVKVLKEIMGHSELSTTDTYLAEDSFSASQKFVEYHDQQYRQAQVQPVDTSTVRLDLVP